MPEVAATTETLDFELKLQEYWLRATDSTILRLNLASTAAKSAIEALARQLGETNARAAELQEGAADLDTQQKQRRAAGEAAAPEHSQGWPTQ